MPHSVDIIFVDGNLNVDGVGFFLVHFVPYFFEGNRGKYVGNGEGLG